MKIIWRGTVSKNDDLPVTVDCHLCQSRLEASLEDINLGRYRVSIDSYGDSTEPGLYVWCPVCKDAGVDTQVRLPKPSVQLMFAVRERQARQDAKA